jgi:tryptophan halogenase
LKVSNVVIVGGGTAGWITAAVLSRSMPHLTFQLVESDAIGTVGVGEATIPQIQHLIRFLGISEADFLRQTSGTFKLGIEFVDWRKRGSSYIHAFSDVGMQLGLVPFHDYWLRACQEGMKTDFWDYSLNALAARADKYAPLQDLGMNGLTGVRHAYHIDATLFAGMLRQVAEAAGVKRVEGRINQVHLDTVSGDIESIGLESGSVVAGDFFIDCSGFRSLLLGEALGVGFQEWTKWLPCDRAFAVQSTAGERFRPFTQSMARDAGWQWRIPLQSRVGNGHVFSSAFMDEDEARNALLDTLEGEALFDPRLISFQTGVRDRFWQKNCVAIGLSAGFLEPLESTSIHLIQSAVNRLISLFPVERNSKGLAEEFNRQSRLEFEGIRDFIILHYKATEREDTEFWRHCRHMEVPQSLKDRMSLFEETGRIARYGDELFTQVGWLQVLIGQGVIPKSYHPAADALSAQKLAQFLQDIRTVMRRGAEELPLHSEYVDRYCRASG